MLMTRPSLGPVGDERGFTLVEVLVAMVTGIIVSLALFAILDFSTKQAARVSESAQATQIGRTAMTHVVDELHSACLSAAFVPVKAGSNASKLVFVNGYFPAVIKEKTEPEYKFVRKDTIEFVPAKGQLTDATALASGEVEASGEYPWKPATTLVLAEHISHAETSGKEEPIFSYEKYNTASATGAFEAATTLKPMTVAEVEAKPAEVAAVRVSFRTSAYHKEVKLTTAAEKGISADQTTLNTFALGAPNSEATITAGPCE
jgi:Tfp pilus assembly protein PilW